MSKNELPDKLIKAYSSKLGFHRNNLRVWIESKKILETTLSTNMCFQPIYDKDNTKLSLVKGNTHKIVTRKKNDRAVIDLNNISVTELFKDVSEIVIKLYENSIVIEPLKEEKQQQKAKAKANTYNPTSIEIFSGGGCLLKSLHDAKIQTVAAIELEDKYLENIEAQYSDIFTYCGDLSKLDVSLLPDADIVSAGIPCTAYSKSGKMLKEDDPTGSLGFYVLKVIEHIRPSLILIEEVPGFRDSAMETIIKFVLKSMNYHISTSLLSGNDFGSLTKRTRYCMVASIKGHFDFNIPYIENKKMVKDILEIPIEDRQWLSKDNNATIKYSLEKELEHIRKGDGFRIGRTFVEDTKVATITRGYEKKRLTDPILVNPYDSNLFSWFTPRELARINGFPDDFNLPDVKSTASEIVGQGVCYEVFNDIGKQIVNHLNPNTKSYSFDNLNTSFPENVVERNTKKKLSAKVVHKELTLFDFL